MITETETIKVFDKLLGKKVLVTTTSESIYVGTLCNEHYSDVHIVNCKLAWKFAINAKNNEIPKNIDYMLKILANSGIKGTCELHPSHDRWVQYKDVYELSEEAANSFGLV